MTQIITKNATWNINHESLEENARASITARETPNIKKVDFKVIHVGP